MEGFYTGLCVTHPPGDYEDVKELFFNVSSFNLILYDNWQGSFDLTEADFSNIIVYVDGTANNVSIRLMHSEEEPHDGVAVYHIIFEPALDQAPASYELSYEVQGITIPRDVAHGLNSNADKTFDFVFR